MKGKLTLCPRHTYYPVPLITTFAFVGAEKWCPYCGYTCGMFGEIWEGRFTQKRNERLWAYVEYTKEYLDAIGTLTCHEMKYKGKWISPRDLPEKEKIRIQKIIDNWKYKVKIEKVQPKATA